MPGGVTVNGLAPLPWVQLARQSLIINGNHDHWQRVEAGNQVPTTTYSNNTSYGPDRMYCLPVGASLTSVSRSTTVPNNRSRFSALITGNASVTTCDYGQRIESMLVNTYGRQPLVFTAFIQPNASAGAVVPTFRIDTPGAVDDFTTLTNRFSQALPSCAAAVWTRISVLVDPTAFTNVANGMVAYLQFPSGPLNANTKTILVAQFDLSPGDQVPPIYFPPDPIDELRRCQRYYFKTFAQGVAVAQASGSTLGAIEYICQVAGVAGPDGTQCTYPVPLRISTATLTTYSTASANNTWRNATDAGDSAAPVTASAGDRSCFVYNAQVATDGVGETLIIHLTANAEFPA